ncbi:MAG: sulfurase, partial [Silicimonas sp.]|nr:sulfurase [Silicimonas sp.]
MPALIPTDHSARITWLGSVPHRNAAAIVTDPLEEMTLSFAGLEGEFHAGLTRPSCSRVTSQYPKGTEIRNTRQISILSAEELARIADTLDLDEIDPAWLGATIVLDGIPDFSHVPPSARLQAAS